MRNNVIKTDEIEDLHRRIAFAEASADPVNFDHMLNRIAALLNKWAQADVVTLILPPAEEGIEPMLHVFGQQPILPIAERSIRDDCAAVLADLEYANLPGEALRVRRGAELTPLHGILRDDYMYRFWWHEMKLDGVTVGIVALYGFVDWVLSPRIRRLLNSAMPMLATGINNAASVENLRLQSDRDELTSLLNQRGIFETLDRECARSTEQGNKLLVLLCEIEDMDEVYGTMDGDAVLQAFSEVAINTVRAFDVVGRLAETEFAFILPDADAGIANIISTQLTEAVSTLKLNGVGLNVSVGISEYQGGTADSLLQQADEALFESRRSRALSSSSFVG
jgi:diguanylate cyclase (GGDEF)-like protein